MAWSFEVVYLARHGETEWNVQGRRQGQLDSSLTAVGIAQACAMASLVAGLSVDGIFTSPLGRARSTADIISSQAAVAVHVIPELAEVHHGEFAGLTNDQIEARHPGALAQRAASKYTWHFPGGESYRDADQRVQRTLELIEAAGSSRPLLVTHEMVGLMLLRRLLDLTPDDALKCSLPHGDVRPRGRLSPITLALGESWSKVLTLGRTHPETERMPVADLPALLRRCPQSRGLCSQCAHV